MRTITVQVTEEHIRKGVRRRAMACPIALALKELGVTHEGVAQEAVRFARPVIDFHSPLPPKAASWVQAFDEMRYFRGCRIKPISFELEVPDERA